MRAGWNVTAVTATHDVIYWDKSLFRMERVDFQFHLDKYNIPPRWTQSTRESDTVSSQSRPTITEIHMTPPGTLRFTSTAADLRRQGRTKSDLLKLDYFTGNYFFWLPLSLHTRTCVCVCVCVCVAFSCFLQTLETYSLTMRYFNFSFLIN